MGEAGAQPQGRAGCIQQNILKALRRETLHDSDAVIWHTWMWSELKTSWLSSMLCMSIHANDLVLHIALQHTECRSTEAARYALAKRGTSSKLILALTLHTGCDERSEHSRGACPCIALACSSIGKSHMC